MQPRRSRAQRRPNLDKRSNPEGHSAGRSEWMGNMNNSGRFVRWHAILACGFVLSAAAFAGTAPAASPPAAHKVSPFRSVKLTGNAQNYYAAVWGIDKLKVSYTASGNLIRFSYHVADAKLAQPLGDEKAAPSLLGQRSRA